MSPIVMQNNDVCFISITFGKPWVIKYYVIQRNHSKESQLSVSCTFPIICTRRRRRHERGYGIRIPFTPYRFLSPTFYTYIHQKSGIGFHTKNIFHLFIFIPCLVSSASQSSRKLVHKQSFGAVRVCGLMKWWWLERSKRDLTPLIYALINPIVL